MTRNSGEQRVTKMFKSLIKHKIPDVRVTMEAHDADRAARRDATFCLEWSKVFCFHFRDA